MPAAVRGGDLRRALRDQPQRREIIALSPHHCPHLRVGTAALSAPWLDTTDGCLLRSLSILSVNAAWSWNLAVQYRFITFCKAKSGGVKITLSYKR
jgi:hypothetical protein